MTTKIELPPLPERFNYTNSSAHWCYSRYTMVRDDLGAYIRAEDYDALRNAAEALRAEVERLQEVVRPKREDECLTLDDWRVRAYYLEENWSRCSRACAIEQDKREKAEARAAKLERALRLALKWAEVLPSGEPLHKENTTDLAAARAALAQEASNG